MFIHVNILLYWVIYASSFKTTLQDLNQFYNSSTPQTDEEILSCISVLFILSLALKSKCSKVQMFPILEKLKWTQELLVQFKMGSCMSRVISSDGLATASAKT